MAKFEIKDTEQGPWTLDLDRLMIDEAIELQKLTGFGPRQWIDALSEDDPLAVRYCFYLARKREGEDVAFKDVNVNIFGMSLTQLDAEDEKPDTVPDEVAEVVPTSPPSSDGALI
jgi:hypothetical protein